MKQFDCVVCGSGVLGTSTAYHLAHQKPEAHIAMFDVDTAGTFASSERNGGAVRAFWQHSLNRRLSLESIHFLRQHQAEVGYHPCGYLWFHKTHPELNEDLISDLSEFPIKHFSPHDPIPYLPWSFNKDTAAHVTFHPEAGLVNSNRLRNWFIEQIPSTLTSGSWTLQSERALIDLEPHQDGWRLTFAHVTSENVQEFLETGTYPKASTETVEARQVVIAMGAWSHQVLKPFINVTYACRPIARHIAMIDAPQAYNPKLPMTITPEGTYFHPEGGLLLTGFGLQDQPEGIDFTYSECDFFENILWPKLYEFSEVFGSCKHMRGWAGIYSYSPDQDGILGRVGSYDSLFQIHSFTGRGVMISPAAGRGLAQLMTKGQFEGLDLSPLSESRFKHPVAEVEKLHL